jgi:hypothetical protein
MSIVAMPVEIKLTLRLQNAIVNQEFVMASKKKKQPEKRDDSSTSEILHRFKTQPLLFIGTVVVLVIVIVAFVVVPAIVPEAGRSEDLIFGYYNRVPIKYVPNNYFAQVQQSLFQNYMPASDDPNYMYTFLQVWRQAFEETVVYMGILDEMKSAGYVVPEDVVDRQVAELSYFQENGRFSPTKYRAMDNTTRMNLWRQVQENIAVQTYYSDMYNLKTASDEPSFIASMASPRRSFDVAIFPFSSYPESEVIANAHTYPALFRVARLSRITITSGERDARRVLETVRSGVTTFEEAARASSQDWAADRGGDIGMVMAFELEYEIRDEQDRERVLNLARGELSDVVATSSGWSFYRADEASQPADVNDLIQVERIKSYVMSNLRGRVEDWLIMEARRFISLAGQIGFSDAAVAYNINKNSFGPIPINYGDSVLFGSISSAGIPELTSASQNQFFWRTAFSTPINTISEPLVVGDSVIVLLPLEEIDADESETEFIQSYFSYWVSSSMENSYRAYFLGNRKLDDRFQEMFWKIWDPSYFYSF